jgi:SNF2 family DNA or RNA helicase
VISDRAIRGFLNRELDNFDWVKKLSPSQIDSALADLVPVHLTEGLWLHQKAILLIMHYQSRFILHVGMGGGKTLTLLTLIRFLKKKGEKPRAIVFVPYLTAVDTWIEEVKKFAPELKCCPLLESSSENIKLITETDCDLYVVCYQSAVAMITTKIKKTGEIKGKWLLDADKVAECFGNCNILIMDEIHRCKGYNSTTFHLCSQISSTAEYVYGLTGTPFGNDMQDLWAEFYAIDFGETLGPNISFFRNVFFTRKQGFWGGVEFNFKKKYKKHLQQMIKNRSIHYKVTDFSDMPEKQYVTRRINFHASIRSHIESAKKELKEAAIGRDAEIAGNAFMQLRQLSSGFITFKDDEERIKVKLDHNPKLDMLCDLIEDMPPECKMVVFHDYIHTNHLISERLTKLKVSHARIWGGQRDPLGQLKKFREDESCRVLIINSKSGSSALNLQFANFIVFFECPSVIDREQAEARCYRPGQKNTVFIYDLFVNGTIDEEHYTAVKMGSDFLTEFLAGGGIVKP